MDGWKVDNPIQITAVSGDESEREDNGCDNDAAVSSKSRERRTRRDKEEEEEGELSDDENGDDIAQIQQLSKKREVGRREKKNIEDSST